MIRSRLTLGAAGATILAIAWGCANDIASPSPSSLGRPLFSDVAPPGSGIEICKFGPVGTTATFTITATGPGHLLVSSPYTLSALPIGPCFSPADVPAGGTFNDKLIWMPDENADPNAVTTLTVTEVGATPGVHLVSIVARTGLGDFQQIAAPPNGVTVNVSFASGGGSLTFKNEGTPFTQFCSYTPGGWGAPPNGGNIASKLYANFSSVYPTGVSVGAAGNYHASFGTVGAVTTYLPSGGTPGFLTHNYNPPTGKTEAGEFLDQVLALRFNVNFSAAGIIKPGFSTAVVQSGPLAGLTTTQVLALANAALGGNTSGLTPYGVTIKDLTGILGNLNGNYDNCTVNNGFLN